MVASDYEDQTVEALRDQIRNNISNGVYSDYHCLRPMSKYSKINYEIYNLL